MPEALQQPQAIVICGDIYIREGQSGIFNQIVGVLSGGCDILKYDAQAQQWMTLPKYQYRDFTMTEVNQQLTVVGGRDATFKTKNKVAVYSNTQGWMQPYPPMTTPRYFPAVFTYHQHLVVAGGCGASWSELATVEILDTSTYHGKWIPTTPLPQKHYGMSSAIINEELYLLGGTLGNQVLSVSLHALTQTGMSPAPWCTLPNIPQETSSAIALHGLLLAVGGSYDKQCSSTIYVYHQERKAWIKVGDLPTQQAYCACCLLPNEEIVLAGGKNRNGDWTKHITVTAGIRDETCYVLGELLLS